MSIQHAAGASRHAGKRGPCLADDARTALASHAIRHWRNLGYLRVSGLNAISEVEMQAEQH